MALVSNKKASFDYEILERFEAGLELYGHEVKSLRAGEANLTGSRVLVRGGEAYLVGASIHPYQAKNIPEGHEGDRNLRLLLTKKELEQLGGVEDKKGLTIIPLAVYNKGRRLKLELAIARGKKKRDKRSIIKKRETDIEIQRTLKNQ
ncbi:MAG: SsrA-binding protein SmpB [Patescibacteria group bacterium]|nr:SsrA-binding protein SmpB [Patescibacteria group bacterium]